VLVRLKDLLTCQRFELIGSFLHLVTPDEEKAAGDDRLRKLSPFLKMMKDKCLELYQPIKTLSIDERMVKSKARSHLIQYMHNKPVKWGFKLWVISDPTGYTLDFNVYTGKSDNHGEYGLAYDVVKELIAPYVFQRYFVFFDNFYTSPVLLEDLLMQEVYATGTCRADRRSIPNPVKDLTASLSGLKVARGTGKYLRFLDRSSDSESYEKTVYTCWRDSRVVCVMSTAYPGHAVNIVSRTEKLQVLLKRLKF